MRLSSRPLVRLEGTTCKYNETVEVMATNFQALPAAACRRQHLKDARICKACCKTCCSFFIKSFFKAGGGKVVMLVCWQCAMLLMMTACSWPDVTL